MDKKLYLIDLDCYARAEENQKKKVKESHCFDFGLLPTKGLQKEFRSFIENRSRQCALATMIQERVIYQRFCRMVKDKHIRVERPAGTGVGTMAAKNPKLASGTWAETDHAGNQRIWERKDSAIEPHHVCAEGISIYRSQRGTG